MGKLEDEAKAGADYLANNAHLLPFDYDRMLNKLHSAVVTPLKVPKVPTLQDELLAMLDELAADIRSGKVLPSYLILGFGEDTTRDGQRAEVFSWDSNGLNRRELIGHLMTYVSRLSVDEA